MLQNYFPVWFSGSRGSGGAFPKRRSKPETERAKGLRVSPQNFFRYAGGKDKFTRWSAPPNHGDDGGRLRLCASPQKAIFAASQSLSGPFL
jgi:hypothetical protein